MEEKGLKKFLERWCIMLDSEEKYDLSYAKKAALILVSLPVLVMYTEAMLIPSLPSIQRQFQVTPSDISWVLSIYLLTGTISVAIFGKLGDMYGKKRVFLIALIIYSIGVTLTGFSPNFSFLLFSRALQGVGIAILPVGLTIVREEFPPHLVPQVQGLISAMFGIGIVIALPIGSYISQYYGWEWTYHTVVPFVIFTLLVSAKVLRESRVVTGGKFDFGGAILLSLFASTGLVAVTRAPHVGWTSISTIMLLLVSLISLIGLVLFELRARNPMVPLYLLFSRNTLIANMGIFLASFGIQLTMQSVTYLFQMPPPYGYGKNILDTGLFMTPNAVAMLFVAPMVGKFIVKFGGKPFVFIGAMVSMTGLLLLAKYATSISIPLLILLIILVGSGISILNVSLINLLIFSVEKKIMGITTGLNSLFRNLGASWGPAIAGTIMTMYSTKIIFSSSPLIELKIPTNTAYMITFFAASILFLLLALSSFFIKEVMKDINRTNMKKPSNVS